MTTKHPLFEARWTLQLESSQVNLRPCARHAVSKPREQMPLALRDETAHTHPAALMAQASVFKLVMCQLIRLGPVLTAVKKEWCTDLHLPHADKRAIALSIEVELNAHTGIRSFENAILAELSHSGCSTLGCELQFVQIDTLQVLADPIQSKLRANHCDYVIARPCFAEAAHKGQIKGEVPRGRNDKIPPQAFSFHTEVRHVQVEPGMRIVGEAAWRICGQLQVVHRPDTAVSLQHGAFSRCQAW